MSSAKLVTPLVVASSRLVYSSSDPFPVERGESTVTRTPLVFSIVSRKLPGGETLEDTRKQLLFFSVFGVNSLVRVKCLIVSTERMVMSVGKTSVD